ncbi:unnamed protein product [Pylaiella littoralis]
MVRGAVWLFASALLSCPTSVRSGGTASLFEFVDEVTEISPQSFPALAESSVPWVLNCYSPGCGHCKRFAPTWGDVGTVLRDSDIKVGAINCVKHRDLCRSLNVPSYPTLLALNSPGAPQGSAADPATKILEKKKNSFANVMDVIKAEFSGALDGAAVADAEMALARGLKEGKHVLDKRIEDVGGVAPCILRMEDAAVSVRFVLRSEVFVGGETLSEDRMAGSLLSFLDLLATTFPGNRNRASFRSLADELRSDPELNGYARWDKRIANLHIGSFAPGKWDIWPAANIENGTPAKEHVIHYTSGLWSLLHALSVSSAPMRRHPYAVMEGIHSFVENFFRCEHCRSHFLEMYDGCENERCKIQRPSNVRGQHTSEAETALALWVWRMHNAVNARLAREGDEKVEPHESLWPSAKICKECWSGYPLEEDQPSWSETEVLKLLKGTFSCPEEVGEGPDAPARSWAVTCMLVCTAAALLMWARKWVEMRGVGLTKKRVDI